MTSRMMAMGGRNGSLSNELSSLYNINLVRRVTERDPEHVKERCSIA